MVGTEPTRQPASMGTIEDLLVFSSRDIDLEINSATQPMIHARAAIRYRVTIFARLGPQAMDNEAWLTGHEAS